jgi:hypothetical protein
MGPSFKEHDGLFAAVDCANWDDFKVRAPEILRWISGSQSIFERFYFRGQSCSSWGLESSFDRKYNHLSYKERQDRYEEIIRAFMRSYDIYGDMDSAAGELFKGNELPQSRSEYETRAQHYGLQTRLMDWSHSLYVSAFFAFSRIDQCTSDLVSIWVLDQCELRALFSSDHVQIVDEIYRDNRRQLWQMGVLIKNKTDSVDLVDIFRSQSKLVRAPTMAKPLLIRFDIPRREAQLAADDLNMMRINSVTLFPGIEGVVQWIEKGGFILE